MSYVKKVFIHYITYLICEQDFCRSHIRSILTGDGDENSHSHVPNPLQDVIILHILSLL